MSIIIHGINLPRAEDDWTLELYIDSNGEVEAHTVRGIRQTKAIELPPHGDLIDRSKIMFTDFEIVMCDGDFKQGLKMLAEKIENAIPIIPAEEE